MSGSLSVEEATLPEGVDPADVTFDDTHGEVLAYDTSQEIEEYPGEYRQYDKPFDPRNGRWYDLGDIYPSDYQDTSIAGGLQADCAYEDCSGFTTVEVSAEIGQKCSDCGAPMMGRAQFSRDNERRRANRAHVAGRINELREEFAREMKRLTDAGVGPAAAMDYLMCSVGDSRTSEWARARGVKERAVKRNMKRVANALGETVEYST